MEKIPFDLKLAVEGNAVVTRSGKRVTELYLFATAKDEYPIRAVIDGTIYVFSKDGRVYPAHADIRRDEDLFLLANNMSKWVNIYYDSTENSCFATRELYDSEEEATEKFYQGYDYYLGAYPIQLKMPLKEK